MKIRDYMTAQSVLWLTGLSMAVFHLYKAYFGIYDDWLHRGVHLIFILLMAFLSNGLCLRGRSPLKKAGDLLLIGLTLALGAYMIRYTDAIQLRAGMPDLFDTVSCVVFTFLLIVAALRVLGWIMTSVTLVFLLYVLVGEYIPGTLGYAGASWGRLVDHFFNSSAGILGLPTSASAVYIAIFVYFGTFLLKSGATEYLTEIAFALAGHRVGGPAKVAVLGSALVGTVMGTGVANVVTTGTVTIPMMIKMGYRPHIAAAIEATASMGGQIMPPIMSSAIFLIAEFTGIPFFELIIYSAVPAIMYFLGIFFQVHFEAQKKRIGAIPKSELPVLSHVLLKGPWYLLLPLPLLVGLLFSGYSPFLAALYSIIAAIACSMVHPKSRMTPRKIADAMVEGSVNCIVIGLACGAASLIMGSIEITGLGLKFSSILISLAGGQVFWLLVFAMVASLILGMGVGTTAAAYVIVATLTIPALVKLGVDVVASHLFCFYFAVLCGITPPVAIGAFVAAGIAKAESMATAVAAVRFGIVGMVVPFLFAYDPSYLLRGSLMEIIPTLALAVLGVYVLAAGTEGYMDGDLKVLMRLFLVASGLLILWPKISYMNLIGLVAFGAYRVMHRLRKRAAAPQ